jgi:[citrate (pro-3S)-lyase] ligase
MSKMVLERKSFERNSDTECENMSINKLTNETDFSRYIEMFCEAAKKYTVLVVASDTPCGSKNFTPNLAVRLMDAGFTIPLHDKWRCSYAALIDEHKLVFEGISQTHPIVCEHEINGHKILLKSICFAASGGTRGSHIIIDGRDITVGGRGLKFAVFDKTCGKVLDSVRFDTYPEIITCHRHGDNPVVAEFKNKNPGVVFISPHYPKFPESELSKNEKFIVDNKIHYTIIKTNADTLITAINECVETADGIREVLSPPESYIGTDGARHFRDHAGNYLNTQNGHRVTHGRPDGAKRIIYAVGECRIMGIGVRDAGTLASQLQKVLNEQAPEYGFAVENYGFALDGTDNEKEITAILDSLPLKSGDIVLGYGAGIFAYNPEFDERPYKYGELFFDDEHCTENSHRLAAWGVFNTLKEHNFFTEYLEIPQPLNLLRIDRDYGLFPEQLEHLEEYKVALAAFYERQFGDCEVPPKIGAIVMNCNPFTLGHRYLIEQCARKVDFLMVFIVREDKSFFPFEDRMKLVYKGTEDLQNVGLIESGNFIISTLTFREYFNKSKLQDEVIDSSNDVTLFAREIAPVAHISVRFAGSEPFDRVTRQYNDTLAGVLPRYGMAFEVIPRLELDGEAVSASRVRDLLMKNEYSKIKKLVPQTTYDYLLELRYSV